MTRIKIISIITGLFVTSGLAWFFLSHPRPLSKSITPLAAGSVSVHVDSVPEQKKDNKIPAGNHVYRDSVRKFSFAYPEDTTATHFKEGDEGETILVREKDGNNNSPANKKKEFQIFISAFDESSPLTKQRILKDVPDLKIENPQDLILNGNTPALMFFSDNPSIGSTREVWFVRNGELYQIATHAELDAWFAGIMSTWKFE